MKTIMYTLKVLDNWYSFLWMNSGMFWPTTNGGKLKESRLVANGAEEVMLTELMNDSELDFSAMRSWKYILLREAWISYSTYHTPAIIKLSDHITQYGKLSNCQTQETSSTTTLYIWSSWINIKLAGFLRISTWLIALILHYTHSDEDRIQPNCFNIT